MAAGKAAAAPGADSDARPAFEPDHSCTWQRHWLELRCRELHQQQLRHQQQASNCLVCMSLLGRALLSSFGSSAVARPQGCLYTWLPGPSTPARHLALSGAVSTHGCCTAAGPLLSRVTCIAGAGKQRPLRLATPAVGLLQANPPAAPAAQVLEMRSAWQQHRVAHFASRRTTCGGGVASVAADDDA